MEILNQNQRRSALWRLVALGVFIFSLLLVVIYSMYKSFSENGNDDYLKLEMEYKTAQQNWEETENNLKTEIARLENKLKTCEEAKPDENEQMKILRERLEEKNDEISRLDRELKRCDTQLANCQSLLE